MWYSSAVLGVTFASVDQQELMEEKKKKYAFFLPRVGARHLLCVLHAA
jgi:hypothetical protein